MENLRRDFDFPSQRVSNAQKEKPEWYANCCDWVIATAISLRDETQIKNEYDILQGNIPQEYYQKVLNPYNATKEDYKRFPATMRNYDMMKGIIRRYISEYIKNPHDFIVGANNPEVVVAKDNKLKEELLMKAEEIVMQRIQEDYQQYAEEGGDPKQYNPQQRVDIDAIIKEFNENYIDDMSAQGQSLLDVIRDVTEDTLLYARAYFEFVAFGECFTYSDVVGNELQKRVIARCDAYPIPNDSMFVEDFDAFAERRKMSYQQIIDEFDDYLSAKDREFLETYYGRPNVSSDSVPKFSYAKYKECFPEQCHKFTAEENKQNELNANITRDINSSLYDVWHVVWRGEVRRAVVTFVNEAGLIDQRIEEDGYKLNTEAGDLNIEYYYEPQVYESVRIGGRKEAIYPYKARAIAYNRGGKLPYNGVMELLPGLGRFSIVNVVLPFQVFYNIVSYHREMTLAKLKLNILMIAKSLLGKVPEETIYRMISSNTLIIDDEDDQGMQKAQQVRILESNIGDYLRQLGELLAEIEQTAKNQVDMTPQRYGEIGNYAGKTTTQEAIVRGSMGSVIIEFMMDAMRERDYNRDLDYTKLAWIDGLDTAYKDSEGRLKYISLDVNSHVFANYLIKAKNSAVEKDKLDQIRQFAFAAAQNGDNMMAIAAITGENVAQIKQLIEKFNTQKEQHEKELKQMEQQAAQMEQEYEMQKIQMKGEIDMQITELEGQIKKEIELIKADANMISFNAEVGDKAQQAGIDRLNAQRTQVEREKVDIQRRQQMIDAYNAEQDRQVKREDIASKERIAKTNKNRYDKK